MFHNIRWTAQKIGQRLQLIAPLAHYRKSNLPTLRYRKLSGPQEEPPAASEIDPWDWDEIAPGACWGERQTNFVMWTDFQAPDDWREDLPLALYLPLGEAPDFIHPEALAYIDDQPYAAVDRFHREFLLPERWLDGKPHRLVLHGFTGIWSQDNNGDGEDGFQLLMGQSALVQIHKPTREFIALARVALDAANHLDENDPVCWRLLDALDAAFKLLDLRQPLEEGFYASIIPAHQMLQDGIQKAGPSHPAHITASGHAHLDIAWLWTLGQTRRKAGRSFHTVMRLMEQFPDYYFTQSQPQLYDFVRQDYPALFEDIRRRAAEGRWELIGGMWVEADCNLSGSESLARQFLLGQEFYRRHFDLPASPVLWLPDVFGYAWNLPQLIHQAGLKYFFTIKIGWSQYNRFPYDSFWWQGLDGTRVLTHFSTTPGEDDLSANGTYNAIVSPHAALGTWLNFQQKGVQDELLMSFGYGDGGGGPNAEMLENMEALADFPGIPKMQGGRVGDFFERLEEVSGPRLPTWNGELYLELHRGTYTTQSRSKRANRKSEFLLHDAEFLASFAAVLDPNYRYPQDELRRAWELTCLNQFHDIIPGSSIHEVYEESMVQYEEIASLGRMARDEALEAIAHQVGGDLLVANPTGFRRSDPVLWQGLLEAGQAVLLADGSPAAMQAVEGGTLIDAGELEPYSLVSLRLGQADGGAVVENELIAEPNLLENPYLRVEFDKNGDIIRIFDKRVGRETLPPGETANQLQAFEDRPLTWDAWDIDIFYDDKMWAPDPAETIRVVERGPLRATLEVRRRILNSPYIQRISLWWDRAEITFDTWIDWRERHILLKAAFPVDVLSPSATYEIQWGNVERPTHRNTSWDWARFETAAQKWVDLSEGDYGVSLINDCKYGHDIHENRMRISLLRGTTHPDPQADLGEHRFTYSLLPHLGRLSEETLQAAYALNDALIAFKPQEASGDQQFDRRSLISVDRPNAVIETVKRAEDGNGLIVRLYEALRRRGPVTLTAGFPLASAEITNLLEERQSVPEFDGNKVQLHLKPYQIVTLRLVPA